MAGSQRRADSIRATRQDVTLRGRGERLPVSESGSLGERSSGVAIESGLAS